MPRRGGSILGQDGREAVLKPDDTVLSDSARPLTLVMGGLPPSKARLRRLDAELSTLTAIAMTGSVGMTGVVYQFLSGLAADIDALESDPTADALGER